MEAMERERRAAPAPNDKGARRLALLLGFSALVMLFASLAFVRVGAPEAANAMARPDSLPVSPFDESSERVFAGGVRASGRTLNQGYRAYVHYCAACHGDKGDGHGPSAYGQSPPPRDFTKGIFKFARQRSSDDLPNDDDLARIVRGGLSGTSMLAWDVPDTELHAVIQYIKTFSPRRWEKKTRKGESVSTLEPFAPGEDPWRGRENQAIERGRALYHLKAECSSCHPSYAGRSELLALSKEMARREPETFTPLTGFRADMCASVPKASEEYGVKILPPEFTLHALRSVRAGSELEDLVRVIAYGVYPVMPAWKDALGNAEIWAIAHYVTELARLREAPGRAFALKDACAAP